MVTPALTLGASAAAARHHSRKSSLVRSLCQKGHARHRFIVTGHKIRRPQSQSLQRMAVSTVSALTEEERQTALQTTLGVTTGSNTMNPHPWTKDPTRNAISKRFLFGNFNQAWAFMSRSALLAEQMDHHPEWFNVYNVVDVTLTTHECQGVSHKDIEMAKAMDDYYAATMPQAPAAAPAATPAPPPSSTAPSSSSSPPPSSPS